MLNMGQWAVRFCGTIFSYSFSRGYDSFGFYRLEKSNSYHASNT